MTLETLRYAKQRYGWSISLLRYCYEDIKWQWKHWNDETIEQCITRVIHSREGKAKMDLIGTYMRENQLKRDVERKMFTRY